MEILPEAVNGCGTRVVTFACGRGNLSVLRENGALESRELDTGKVLSSGKLDWDLPMETAPWGYRFSPDGSVLASVRRRDPLPDEPRLEIYRHSGNGFTRTLSLDLPEMKRSLHTLVRLIASSAEPGRYYLAYGGGILEVDEQVAESRIIAPSPEEAASGAIWFAVSPDGRFLVRYVDKGLEVLDRRSGQRRRVPVPGDRSELFGTRGFFIGSLAGEVVFRSYDGTEKRKLSTGAGRPLAESPGGRLVALATDREKPPVRVEIWEVDGARKICEWSEAGAFEPAFSGPPYRVLCATRVEGKSGASWISSEFRVHDAATGKVLQRLDLSADAGPAR